MRLCHKRSGFMVIEILLVITIIAIIVTIVFLREGDGGDRSMVQTGQDAVQDVREAGQLMEQNGAWQQNAIENLAP